MPDAATPLVPRQAPQSIEAEQSVIGALMLDPAALVGISEFLTESDFYDRRHRILYRAILALSEHGKPFDAVTLGEWAEGNGLSEQIGGAGYLVELASTTPSAANIQAYAEIVRDRAMLRHLIDAGTDVVNQAFAPAGRNALEVYSEAVASLSSLTARINTTTPPPVDLFDESAPPPIRPEWLPPAIADFVFASSEVKGSPPEVLALSALVTCSAACHDQFRVQPRSNEPGWTESARLWGMIVGDPSAMKSPPMKLAQSPLSELNRRLVEDYRTAFSQYLAVAEEHKAAEKQRARAAAKGDGFTEPAPLPDKPPNRRIIVNDATIEKLADLLADNPRGMLYVNDELAGWFASMDMYAKSGASGRDRSYWLRFYDGGQVIIDRMSRETTVVENASMSVLGAIQPDRIRAMAQRMDDDGLLQRFMVTMIPTAQRFPSDKPEPVPLQHAYKLLVQQIYNTHPGDGHAVIRMDDDAQAVQTELMSDIRAMIGAEGLPPMLRSHLAKWPGLFPRLCLTYHMVGCAAARVYPTTYPLTGATARRVAAMMRGWLLPSAIAFYTGLMGNSNPAFDLARQIGNLILGRQLARLSNRDLTMSLSAWRSAPEWRQRAAIAALEQAGWLLPATAGDGERKPQWPVNPRVHTEFATRAAKVMAERARLNGILSRARGKPAANADGQAPAD